MLGLGNGMAYPSIQLMMLDLVPTRRGAVMSCASFLVLIFNAIAAVALTPYVATEHARTGARRPRDLRARVTVLGLALRQDASRLIRRVGANARPSRR